MALVSMRQLLDHAAENNYGVPAFNVNNLEQVQAIMEAASKTSSPVIMQASAGARKYAGEPFLRHLILAAIEQYPDIPIVMHQDHGASPAACQRSIRSGFSSVMMDGSLEEDAKTPSSYEYNVDVTRHVVNMAHPVGVSVEGELGCLGSLETMEAGKEDGSGAEGTLTMDMLLTDPEQAADFVAKTGVDALAIAIGTSHGAYKFSRKPTGDILAIDRIRAINAKIPNTHLVMHGSSSVPQEWLQIIREHGGDMKETYGVPVEEIQEGIKHGVRKINIDTDIRLAMTGAIRRAFDIDKGEFDPRKYLKPAKEAAKSICEARFEAFGTAGNAEKIKPMALDDIAIGYEQS
ncbi:MAG: fructose-bisphosphate aldolase class II [Burkholderiales bacterium]|jgi:fructose-bisphosphate aldolase class II|nr:fructose-bisphosphate aldolase class II [Betaproteobacteria bacterium]MDC3408422.1 fructose-bisphosphate aldolase class II [Burkholderiales bacterium]MBT6184674.1 fructose-bisphosphate aldolase class II [Betaproteobacteria bacterium]MBT6529311.1 fructose-bisphosphate aldolase class II [Betaproteobacteria bacterium]MBT7997067.1 fructose-bisphosphate aldolase class II [Betaproteobacteria bacterium]